MTDRAAPMRHFEVMRAPVDSDFRSGVNVDGLVPDPDWFWGALQWHCESECCGLDAYDFSEAAVRNALGQTVKLPRGVTMPRGQPDNVPDLIDDLTLAALEVRKVDAPLVATSRLGNYLTPAALADLLDYLADTLRLAM